MAANISEEIRRLRRRKQLNFYPGQDVHGSQESSSDGAMDSPGSPATSSFATTYSSSTKEKPLFTFRQVRNQLFLLDVRRYSFIVYFDIACIQSVLFK
jgi:hypothetical protein